MHRSSAHAPPVTAQYDQLFWSRPCCRKLQSRQGLLFIAGSLSEHHFFEREVRRMREKGRPPGEKKGKNIGVSFYENNRSFFFSSPSGLWKNRYDTFPLVSFPLRLVIVVLQFCSMRAFNGQYMMSNSSALIRWSCSRITRAFSWSLYGIGHHLTSPP